MQHEKTCYAPNGCRSAVSLLARSLEASPTALWLDLLLYGSPKTLVWPPVVAGPLHQDSAHLLGHHLHVLTNSQLWWRPACSRQVLRLVWLQVVKLLHSTMSCAFAVVVGLIVSWLDVARLEDGSPSLRSLWCDAFIVLGVMVSSLHDFFIPYTTSGVAGIIWPDFVCAKGVTLGLRVRGTKMPLPRKLSCVERKHRKIKDASQVFIKK